MTGSLELLPAIDLRGGRVVRLIRGDDAARTVYGDDPVAVLAGYAAAGVSRVHVVDLDAAFGEPPQSALVGRLAAAARDGGTTLQLGGGLRRREAVEAALDAGCERAVVGSLVGRDFELFTALAVEHPGRLVPALDVAGGEVRVDGWRRDAGAPLEELTAALAAVPGLPAVLVTDIERDGTLQGPNLELAASVARAAGVPALLSGGVRSLADLVAARRAPEIAGAVVGRALYAGEIELAAALAVCAGDGGAA